MSGAPQTPFEHTPVMVERIVEVFGSVPAGTVVDLTAGGGGHSAALLAAHRHLEVLAIDRDLDAVAAATSRLGEHGARARVVHARFSELARVLDDAGIDRPVGVLADLGVSSPQLDRGERGFSYRHDGPLDMRMDAGSATTAADLVNGLDVGDLADLLAELADERHARRIARAIVAARPVATTAQLADVVRGALPGAVRRAAGGDPARKTFQALRIAVNDELGELRSVLTVAVERLAPRGRLAVISYHSGEDRIVKEAMRQAETGGCTCPPRLPCVCGAVPIARPLRRGIERPTAAEIEANRRAESARLRVAERLPEAQR